MRSAAKHRALGVLASVAVSLGCLVAARPARADSVNLIDLTATVYGGTTNIYSFQAPGPGTVWVSLTDVDWPEPFQSLSTSILSSHSTLGQANGPSLFDVEVGQAGTLYAYIAGVAGNTLGFDVGMYSLHVGFAPAGEPVPLPEALRLLVVGLGLIGAVRLLWARRQSARESCRVLVEPLSSLAAQ